MKGNDLTSDKQNKDGFWVKKVLDGDRTAFDTLFRKYTDAVYGVCYHYIRDFEEAKDLVQETFVSAYLNLPKLKERNKFGQWIYGIAVNTSKMWLRKCRNIPKGLDAKDWINIREVSPGPDKVYEKKELQTKVREAIDTLSEKNKLALTLHYINGYKSREIADFLGVSESSVKGRLHKSKGILKEKLSMVAEYFQDNKLEPDYYDTLMKYVRDMDPGVRGEKSRRAVDKLLREASVQVRENVLLKGLSDKDWGVRRWTLGILINSDIRDSSIQERVIELLDDTNKHVRIASMMFFAYNHQNVARDVVPLIIRNLEDKNKYVRRWAAVGLGYFFKDERAIKPLVKALDDEDWRVGKKASWAINETLKATHK